MDGWMVLKPIERHFILKKYVNVTDTILRTHGSQVQKLMGDNTQGRVPVPIQKGSLSSCL